MYTQCPNCNVIFSMSEDDLDVYQGLVRCGRCSEVFNASWNLVDSIPDEESAGSENITPKPEEQAVATPDVIDEFILDNVESDEDPGIPSEPGEAREQEQSVYSENGFDGSDIDVERDLNVAEAEPVEAAIDASQATATSPPVENVSEAGLGDRRTDDDLEGGDQSLEKDELERVLGSETEPESESDEEEKRPDFDLSENDEPEALDQSFRAAQTEQVYPDAESEPESDKTEETSATNFGLPDDEALQTEPGELGQESLESDTTAEEIVMEGPGPDGDVKVVEESPEAVEVEQIYTEIESESDEAEGASATDLGLPDDEALQAEPGELESESLETDTTAEEIIMEEPGPDEDLGFNEESPNAVDEEKISWETQTDSESDIDHTDIEQIEQEPEVVASADSIVVDELDKPIQPPEQAAVNEFKSFNAPDETSSVPDISQAHDDEENVITDVDSPLDNEDTSIGDTDDGAVKTIDDVLSDMTELESVNDDVSK